MNTATTKTDTNMELRKIQSAKYFIPVLRYGAAVTMVQAVAYIVLSCIGLAAYHQCPDDNVDLISMAPSEFFNYMLKQQFYTDSMTCFGKDGDFEWFITSEFMLAINATYLPLSVLWLAAAILSFGVDKWETVEKKYFIAFPWIFLTFVIFCIDTGFGALAMADLVKNTNSELVTAPTMTLVLVSLVVMLVLFRGFVLLILNFWFAAHALSSCLCVRNAIKEKQLEQAHNTLTRGPISAYDNSIEARSARWLSGEGQVNRPHLQSTPNMYGRTDSHTLGVINHGYASSNHLNNSGNINNRSSESYDTTPSSLDRRSMSWDRDVPVAPKPDYSPQPMRAMRSALKPVPPTRANNYMR